MLPPRGSDGNWHPEAAAEGSVPPVPATERVLRFGQDDNSVLVRGSRDAATDLRAVPSIDDLLPASLAARLIDEPARFIRKGFARVAELLPSRLNLSWITDELAVGGAFSHHHIPRLRRIGVDAVIDCRDEASDDEHALKRQGIAFLRLPTPDAHQLEQGDLETGVAWALERFALGSTVYVHCTHGVGRAPLMGSCILVASGYSTSEAIGLVKTRRWQASPNEEQLEALLEFARRRNGTH